MRTGPCSRRGLGEAEQNRPQHAAWIRERIARGRVRRRRTSAAGSTRGRTPGGPAWAGRALSFPCRRTSSWSWFRRVRAPRRRRRPGRAARLALQPLQRFGSFLKFLSAKKCCSPAVQTNSAPQSTQFSDLVLELHRPLPLTTRRVPALSRALNARRPARVTFAGRVVRLDCTLLRLRGAASCAYACAPAPAWRGAGRPASGRTSAS